MNTKKLDKNTAKMIWT